MADERIIQARVGADHPLTLFHAGETEGDRRVLERALELVRVQTGLLWGAAAADGPESVAILYGTESWLREAQAQRSGPLVAIERSPEDVRRQLARQGLDLRSHENLGRGHVRVREDLPGLVAALTRPHGERQLTALRRDDCQATLDLTVPWTEIVRDALVSAIGSAAPPSVQMVKLAPLGRASFGIVVSHDVDYVTTTFRYRWTRAYYLAAAVRRAPRALPRSVLHYAGSALATSPWRHLRTLALEQELGVRSEWFVFARTDRNEKGVHAVSFNPQYRLEDQPVRSLLDAIGEAGHVLGLHASPEAGGDAAQLERERDLLATAAGAPVRSVRHHMGRLRWPAISSAWVGLGFDYDSSFIVNDAQGYRLGTGGVVPLEGAAGTTILELSPTWMDTVAFNYEAKSPGALEDELLAVVESAARRGAIEGVVWHDIPMSRDGSELGVYRRFLESVAERGGLAAPCEAFAHRAAALGRCRLVDVDGAWCLELPSLLRDDPIEVVGPDSTPLVRGG